MKDYSEVPTHLTFYYPWFGLGVNHLSSLCSFVLQSHTSSVKASIKSYFMKLSDFFFAAKAGLQVYSTRGETGFGSNCLCVKPLGSHRLWPIVLMCVWRNGRFPAVPGLNHSSAHTCTPNTNKCTAFFFFFPDNSKTAGQGSI